MAATWQPPDRNGGGKRRPACLAGCGIVAILSAITLAWLYFGLRGKYQVVRETASLVAADLRAQGYTPLGEGLDGKGYLDLVAAFWGEQRIAAPVAGKTYAVCGSVTVDAPCAFPLLLIGRQCRLNQSLAAPVCFLGLQDSTLMVAPGVTVPKVFVNDAVRVINNGQIVDGVSHQISEFYDFTGLDRVLTEKFGKDYTQISAELKKGHSGGFVPETPAAANKERKESE